MRILCVAEKPSIARSISEILSSGNGLQNNAGLDKFCRNYDFAYRMPGTGANAAALGRRIQQGEWVDMTVTSVRGHVMEHDFPDTFKKWHQVDPSALFTAPIVTRVSTDARQIAKNLQAQVRRADLLMIWTDCDREGEHIGSEIASVCKEVKRSVIIKRARFSAIIASQIHAAAQNPVDLDYRAAAAVESRIELDLRLGAAFTRFQTLSLQDRFRDLLASRVISYGPCQFPTLGFVVEQYYKVMDFVPEPFWFIAVMHRRAGVNVDFRWARNHLFVEDDVTRIYQRCIQNPKATVKKVESKQVRKFKPHPLTTVELQKAGGRLLRMAPKKVLDIAEKLYQRGLLSYPRTETDQYDPAFDFRSYIGKQTSHPEWGAFASNLANASSSAFETPANGRKNDKAHPPIHPTKPGADLSGDEKRVYDYITRRFLASCSKHAVGQQTTIMLAIADENFTTSGVFVLERNYLDVYPFDSWGGPALPAFEQGETFVPTKIEKKEGETSRPKLLTEADLVSLMDKNGIGTDATIAEHIAKIIEREYVMIMAEGQTKYLVPSTLGMGLAEGYNGIELAGEKSLCKPLLRRETEERMGLICEGTRTKEETVQESLQEYHDVYQRVRNNTDTLMNSVARYLIGEVAADTVTDGVHSDGHGRGPPPDGISQRSPEPRPGNAVASAPAPPPTGPSARNPTVPVVDLDDEFDSIPIIDLDDEELSLGDQKRPSQRDHEPPIKQVQSVRRDAPVNASGPDCRCPHPAVLRTVQKEGHNKGRTFWSCSKPMSDESACGFFEWSDGPSSNVSTRFTGTLSAPHPPRADSLEEAVRRCQCGLQAQRIEATQLGPNQGRALYKCPNISKVAQCSYFEWEDGGPSGGGSGSVNNGSTSDTACFTCGETGHWSSACPHSNQRGGPPEAAQARVRGGKGRGARTTSASATTPNGRSGRGGSASVSTKRGKCYECGKTGHWASDCPDPGTAGEASEGRTSRAPSARVRGKRRRT